MKKYSKKMIIMKELDRIISLLQQLRVFIEMPYKKKPRDKTNKIKKK